MSLTLTNLSVQDRPNLSHSLWRLELAQQIAPAYAGQQGVVAVFAHGSAARMRADRYSDIEIAILWSRPPTERERLDAIIRAGGSSAKLADYAPGYQAWTEEFYINGVKVDTGHWTLDAIDGIVQDVTYGFDTSASKQTTLSVINHAFILHGETQIQRIQDSISNYPDELSFAMITQHLSFSPIELRKMLASRNELPLLYENHCHSIRQIIGVLLGLNRIYYPGFKWTQQLIEEMNIKPEDLFARFEKIVQAGAVTGTDTLEQIIEELFDLIETKGPSGIDVESCRTRFRSPIPTAGDRPHSN